MLASIDAGAWLQATSTIAVAIIALIVGLFVRRNKTTADAIDAIRLGTSAELEAQKVEANHAAELLRSRVDGLYSEAAAIRADVAQIKGYLAAVQGDHFAFRRDPGRLEPELRRSLDLDERNTP